MTLDLADKAGGLTRKGKLPAFAWPGGYPLIYITRGGDVLCAECATTDYFEWLYAIPSGEQWQYDPPIAVDVHWEGPAYYCASCGKQIESAYGDPWAEEESEQGQ